MKTLALPEAVRDFPFWTLAAALMPALLLFTAAKFWLLPRAGDLRVRQAERILLERNTYEAAWLDSTEKALEFEVARLASFRQSLERSYAPVQSAQDLVDTVRSLAEGKGLTITQTAPTLLRSPEMRAAGFERVKVRLDGHAGYSALMDFFADLYTGHPGFFLEEISLRRGREQLEFWFSVAGDLPLGGEGPAADPGRAPKDPEPRGTALKAPEARARP